MVQAQRLARKSGLNRGTDRASHSSRGAACLEASRPRILPRLLHRRKFRAAGLRRKRRRLQAREQPRRRRSLRPAGRRNYKGTALGGHVHANPSPNGATFCGVSRAIFRPCGAGGCSTFSVPRATPWADEGMPFGPQWAALLNTQTLHSKFPKPTGRLQESCAQFSGALRVAPSHKAMLALHIRRHRSP